LRCTARPLHHVLHVAHLLFHVGRLLDFAKVLDGKGSSVVVGGVVVPPVGVDTHAVGLVQQVLATNGEPSEEHNLASHVSEPGNLTAEVVSALVLVQVLCPDQLGKVVLLPGLALALE
jgi:hypothetical protein